MLTWLSQNIGTIIVLLVVVLIVAAIVKSMRRDKKNGKSSCGGNCAASVNHKHGGSTDRRSLFGVASTS